MMTSNTRMVLLQVARSTSHCLTKCVTEHYHQNNHATSLLNTYRRLFLPRKSYEYHGHKTEIERPKMSQ